MEFSAIKGFKDILPDKVGLWQKLEAKAREVFGAYGFQEIRPPHLEWTEVFSRSIGQDTDIVSKEMYSFNDSRGRSMSLRPEATASVVRAYIQHRLYQANPVQKLFTIGPMFRHERPQKGRFRQFYQIDAEIFGDPGPRSDADLIVMVMSLLTGIGLTDVALHINSLGCPQCRTPFREELKGYLLQRSDGLCNDCQRRAKANPMRVFDCKKASCQGLVENAPSVLDFLCEDCQDHLNSVQDDLKGSSIPFVINHKLVRGLEYYVRTAFEIQTDRLGSQNAVAGGGRYDGLVKELGGPDHSGIGFAIGMERLIELLQRGMQEETPAPALFIAALGEVSAKKAFQWVQDLRGSGLWVEMDYAAKGLKAQMKRADRLGAGWVLIVGEDELSAGKVILRNMESKGQEEIPLDGLIESLKSKLISTWKGHERNRANCNRYPGRLEKDPPLRGPETG